MHPKVHDRHPHEQETKRNPMAAGCGHAEEGTLSSLDTVTPAPAMVSRGCISKTVLKSFSEVAVREEISALGCSPYSMGLSVGR